jgi:transcriptional adapter 3
VNKARESRLAAIARDRLAYQEYLELRDSIDRNINTLYAKLQKKDAPKLSKKKKRPLQGAAAAAHAAATAAVAASQASVTNEDAALNSLPPCPAALGLTPDKDNRLTVNEQLKQLVETRRQWVESVGTIFDEKERESPGKIYGLPQESIYKGVEEEVDEIVKQVWAKEERPPNNSVFTRGPGMSGLSASGLNGVKGSTTNALKSHVNGGSMKGKEKIRGDAMDVG